MGISLTRELAALPPSLEKFLAERIERNVQASLLVHARAGRLPGSNPLFAWGVSGGQIQFFAMRTPPWPLLVSELSSADAEPLMERWLATDPAPPGVSGVPESARAVAAAWQRQTAGHSRCRRHEAMHVLREAIDPLEPPAGTLRVAGAQDRELPIDWERAFVAEAGVVPSAGEEAERTVDRRLATGAQYLWDDDGPASTLALAPQVAGTVRIGPVYTLRRGATAAMRALPLPVRATTHWREGRASACCSPISPTRPRTRSTRPSAFAAAPSGRSMISCRRSPASIARAGCSSLIVQCFQAQRIQQRVQVSDHVPAEANVGELVQRRRTLREDRNPSA